jgi:tetratricopeptide (TPR) repeat protein
MKRNICIFLIICLVSIHCVYAQTAAIDSLKHLLKNEMKDSSRCLLMSELGFQYQEHESNPDSALIFAQEGLALARKINYLRGEVECLNLTAWIFKENGNDAEALKVSLQALKKSEALPRKSLSWRTLNSIGDIYSDQGDEDKALEYTLKAKDFAVSFNDKYFLMVSELDLGDNYEKLNQFDSARYYSNLAYDLAVKLKVNETIGVALNNLGNIYLKMQQPVVAMGYYKASLPYTLVAIDNDDMCEATLGMAEIFLQQGQQDSCLHYAKRSYDIAHKSGIAKYVLSAANFLADYYKQHQVVDSAYAYLSVVIATKDKIFSNEKVKEIQNLTFEESMRQQEITAEKKKAEEDHVRNLQLLAIGVFIPVFFIGVLLLSRTKVKPRVVEFLGILSLLLFFEFITDLIYPYVSNLTNENPIWEMLFLVSLAALLEPLNFKLEHWVKGHLVHKPVPVPIPVLVESNSEDTGSE